MIIHGDALTELKKLPSDSVDCCVTSPPYYRMRDYGAEGQIGLETSVQDYIEKLLNVFNEVKRVLRPDGTLWVNIADSYAGSGKGASKYPENALKYKQGTNKGLLGTKLKPTTTEGCKAKVVVLYRSVDMNKAMEKINPDTTANQAVDYVVSNPCCICSCESFCGVKYKNTCRIRRKIRLCLWVAKEKAEEVL